MKEFKRGELVEAAKEMNDRLGIDPPIDVTLDRGALKKLVRTAAIELVTLEDKFSEATQAIVSEFRSEGGAEAAPAKGKKAAAAKKEEEPAEEEEPEESEDDDAEDDGDESDDEDDGEEDAEEEAAAASPKKKGKAKAAKAAKGKGKKEESEDADEGEAPAEKPAKKPRKERAKKEPSEPKYTKARALHEVLKDGGGTRAEITDKLEAAYVKAGGKPGAKATAQTVSTLLAALIEFNVVVKDGKGYKLRKAA
jgi:chromatin remodeling complex protein RSC6